MPTAAATACSFSIISDPLAVCGRLTRDAIAVESVSMMILELEWRDESGSTLQIYSADMTYPSSMVSSRQRRTMSKFSNTLLFSTWFLRSMDNASENVFSAAASISSFSVAGPMM